MNYGKVLSRAWEITWRWKVLWILGFLASLGSGGGGGGGSYSTGQEDLNRWRLEGPPYVDWPLIAGVIAALVVLALLIGIVLWVISTIARGGLIAGVQQVEDEGTTSFLDAWRVGRKRFWTLFGLSVLSALPLIVAGLALAFTLVLGIVTMSGWGDFPGWAGGMGIASAVCCGGALCCGLILMGIVLDQIRTYGERAAILEDLGWLDAFKRGWEVLKENLVPTIILWIIFFVIGVILATVILSSLAIAVLPFIAIFRSIEPGPWLVLPLCCGGLLTILIAAVLGSVIQTFTSATWTLAYRELTAYVPIVVPEVAPE
ncbi:hypothetical protein ACFLT5_02405 [Chloroflexota bacterium]